MSDQNKSTKPKRVSSKLRMTADGQTKKMIYYDSPKPTSLIKTDFSQSVRGSYQPPISVVSKQNVYGLPINASELQAELDKERAKREKGEKEIEELTQTIDENNQCISKLQQENEQYFQDFEAIRKVVEEKDALITRLTAQVSTLEGEVCKISGLEKALEEERRLFKEGKSSLEKKIEELNDIISEFDAERDDWAHEIRDLDEINDKITQERDELKEKLANKQNKPEEVAKASNDLEPQRINSTKNRVFIPARNIWLVSSELKSINRSDEGKSFELIWSQDFAQNRTPTENQVVDTVMEELD